MSNEKSRQQVARSRQENARAHSASTRAFTARRPLPAARFSSAFTMVELLVSIALVVVLILGINAVFKYSADAVGTGQAIGDVSRQNRAVQAVLTQDLS